MPVFHHRNAAPVTRRVVLGAAAVAAAGSAAPAHAALTGDSASPSLGRDAIDDIAAELDADLVALRRDLHAHPEGPGEELRTASIVAELLTAAGLEVTTGVGGHGVVAVLKGRGRGRTVAYRADMDAVPAADQVGGGTAVEHLCGHDIHTTVGVGVAQVLARLRHRLRGTVVFVFQPAEESLEGARAMIEDGVLERYAPEEIHALHCGALPVGVFGVNPGVGLPGQDRGTVTVAGADAADRAAALAAEIDGLGTVAPPQDSADLQWLLDALTVPDGPLAEFVYMRTGVGKPDADGRVAVEVSYRCWPEDRYTEVRAEIDRITQSHEDAVVDFVPEPFPAMVGPEKDAHVLRRHLRREGRDVETIYASLPFNGEDFALFFDEIPGTYTYLGVQAPDADITTAFPHMPSFDPDEQAIGHGVRAMAGWLVERADGRE
jgi:metal-dependent amidase/aminoacylase/carboxypeptidase family protein